MDALTNYIQNGKKLTVLKLFSVFLLMTVLIVGGIGTRLYYAFSEPDIQSFLKEIPKIEIQDETVISPENKTWERKLANDNFLFRIDTTRDTADMVSENGILLTKKSFSVALNNQVKKYQLPKEKVVIDTPFLTNLTHMILFNTCFLIGLILLLAFLLGQITTSILTSFILWIFQKQRDKECCRRSSFIGWISVLVVNIALRFTQQGFSLLTCVIIATGISVFCLLWTGKEN